MLVLFETPAGYAIFKLLDEGKLKKTKNLYKHFQTPEDAGRIVRLTHFERFADTTEALAATTAAVEGKVSKNLKHALKTHVNRELQEQLLVADAKLGSAIREKLNVQCVANTAVQELMRCIRSQADSLITGLPTKEMTAMALGLAHSLSRYKLKFSPDKVDTMIVQAVSLLDDLDKELNNYVMRLREWYGWHFPELGKIVTDNLIFAKTVKIIGTRDHTATSDLSDILPEEIEKQVKEAAEISMGTEIADNDIFCIQNFCDQIIDITGYRANLWSYLQGRMMAIAPNLTVLVGDLVGARLISHAGSLINLAKHPASTVQILGAEKALFRALKTKKDTPKYGLIYHSQLVGQSSARIKGKASRMLAAKASLATRVDALGEDGTFTLGAEHRAKLEARLRILEEGGSRRISGTSRANARFERYRNVAEAGGEARQYPAAADSTLPSGSKRKRSESETVKEESAETTKRKKKKKMQGQDTSEVKVEESEESPKKKKKKIKQEKLDESAVSEVKQEETENNLSKKKKKKTSDGLPLKEEIEDEAETSTSSKKKKKIKQEISPVKVTEEEVEQPVSSKKKKKKAKQGLDESGVSPLIEEVIEAETPTSSKKKKKKVKQEPAELEVSVEAREEPEQLNSEKKKKKKKKHLETE